MVIDHLHIVGDVFDRGPRADLIMEQLMKENSIDIQWGNHDVLWMGAAAGSAACVAVAVKNCLHYDNLDMLENAYGRIINVASVAGVYGNAKMAHYSATKGAVIAMTRALAKEVTDQGVLVNCVSPGSVSNSQNEDIDFFSPSELSFMGRTGTDRENANLILFLASDEASYISGQNIQIDGCRKKM